MWTYVVTEQHVLCLVPVPVHGRATVWTCVVTVQHALFILLVPVHCRATVWAIGHVLSLNNMLSF